LERRHETAEGKQVQQYGYFVLEANLVFPNGLTLALRSEFLSYGEADSGDHKQVGQLLTLTALARDVGIAPNTAKSWLSILQASRQIFLLESLTTPAPENGSSRPPSCISPMPAC